MRRSRKKKLKEVLRKLDGRFGFDKIRGHTFYSRSLSPTSVILDLGANLGEFSNRISSKYQCKSHAVEASPDLFDQIDVTPLIKKYHYAIADTDQKLKFHTSGDIEAGNVMGAKTKRSGAVIEVPGRQLATLINELKLNEIDLIKIDIEGAEIPVFDHVDQKTLAHVKQFSVEFHDFIKMPNVTEQDVWRVIEKVKAMGFSGISMGRKNMDWFFWNASIMRLPLTVRFYLIIRKCLRRLIWK